MASDFSFQSELERERECLSDNRGLTITHAVIVKKHAGTITFESEVGKGATFIVWLPVQHSAEIAA
jgi:signal transduction histidine kinase